MITDFKPYPVYKDSGVPWLGAVPEHWSVQRVKSLLCERVEKGHPDEPLLAATQTKGVVRKDEYGERTVIAQKDLHLLKLVSVGDFVISLRSFQGGIELAYRRGIISPAYTILVPKSEHIRKYFRYLFKSSSFINGLTLCVTGIREGQNIDYERLSRDRVPVPPHEERDIIVYFLNHMTQRIDNAIHSKKMLIALLEEQKLVIFRHAVTRGLDFRVPLKNPAVSWMGKIPEHWQTRRIKHVAKILRGKFSFRPRNDPSLYDGPYPFIQTGSVAQAGKFITKYGQTLNEKGLTVSKIFPKGTLVMTIAANIGDVALLDFDACFPDSIVGLVSFDGFDQNYLFAVFKSMKPEFLTQAPVNTQGNLSIERIGVMQIPVPPLAEQVQIAEHLDRETKGLDLTIDRTTREIQLLREYRIRLIADVVTGKLDVRATAADLPKIVEANSNEAFDDEDMELDMELPDEDEVREEAMM